MTTTQKAPTAGRIVLLPIDAIAPNPSQPRKIFEPEALAALSQSIAENGLLQPISVRALGDGRYELIAGERRLQASRMAGRSEIAAIVIPVDGKRSAVLALLENLQRADLSFFEQAEGFLRLMQEHGFTQEQLAQRLGLSQPTVANKLRLLQLDAGLRQQIQEAGLTERHARALLRVTEASRQEVLTHIIRRGLNVEQTEQYIARYASEQRCKRQARQVHLRSARLFVNTIEKAAASIRRMGISLELEQTQGEGYMEYVLRIPVKEA